MRILVTGGLGTVEAGLVSERRERGITSFPATPSISPDEVGFSVRTDVTMPLYARCDLGEFRQIERVMEYLGTFDYVYHFAAGFGR